MFETSTVGFVTESICTSVSPELVVAEVGSTTSILWISRALADWLMIVTFWNA